MYITCKFILIYKYATQPTVLRLRYIKAATVFSSHRFLYNRFFRKLEHFLLVFDILAFTVHLYSLISHARALTGCTCDNAVCAVPAQKWDLT